MRARRVALVSAVALPIAVAACAKPPPKRPSAASSASSWSWAPPPPASSSAAPPKPTLATAPTFAETASTPVRAGVFAKLPGNCHPMALALDEKLGVAGCMDGSIVRFSKEPGEVKVVHPAGERLGSVAAGRGRIFFGSNNMIQQPKQGTVSSFPDDGGPTLLHEGRFLGPAGIALVDKGVVVDEPGLLWFVPSSGGAPVTFARAGTRRGAWAARADAVAWVETLEVQESVEHGWVVRKVQLPRVTPTDLLWASGTVQGATMDAEAMYLAVSGRIHRVPLSGAPATVVTDLGPEGTRLPLRVRKGFVYWAVPDRSNEWSLLRAPITGGGRERVGRVGESDNLAWLSYDVDDTHAFVGRVTGQLIRIPLPTRP